jgi:hypothetical protein
MSQLPDWASRVFIGRSPLPPHGPISPNPERLALWQAIHERFKKQWFEIAPENWKVPQAHESYVHLIRSGDMYSGSEYVKAGILECAVSIAFQIGTQQNPAGVKEAVAELNRLNSDISDQAEKLAELFEKREELMTKWMLTDEWLLSGESAGDSLDSFDFFDALELLLQRQPYYEWGSVADEKVTAFLHHKLQSRTSPDWQGLLSMVAERSLRQAAPTTTADAAVIASRKIQPSEQNHTNWPQWALRLIGALDGHAGNGLPHGFFLACLAPSDVASLARVALNAPDGAFSDDQMKMLIRRYKERKNKERFD